MNPYAHTNLALSGSDAPVGAICYLLGALYGGIIGALGGAIVGKLAAGGSKVPVVGKQPALWKAAASGAGVGALAGVLALFGTGSCGEKAAVTSCPACAKCPPPAQCPKCAVAVPPRAGGTLPKAPPVLRGFDEYGFGWQ